MGSSKLRKVYFILDFDCFCQIVLQKCRTNLHSHQVYEKVFLHTGTIFNIKKKNIYGHLSSFCE